MNKKGFTLIEILVVVSIIIILALIVVPTVSDSIKRAKDAKRIAELSEISKMIKAFQALNDQDLPSSYNPLTGDWETGCIGSENPFLPGAIQMGIANNIPKSEEIKDPSGFSYPGAGCYRYRYYGPEYDICGDGAGYGILYTACQSKTCPTEEIDKNCPAWKFLTGEGWRYYEEDIDNQVYMIFVKGN